MKVLLRVVTLLTCTAVLLHGQGTPTQASADLASDGSPVRGSVRFDKGGAGAMEISFDGLRDFDPKKTYDLYLVSACPGAASGRATGAPTDLAQTVKGGRRLLTIKSGKVPDSPVKDPKLEFGQGAASVVGKFVLVTEGGKSVACAVVIPPRF